MLSTNTSLLSSGNKEGCQKKVKCRRHCYVVNTQETEIEMPEQDVSLHTHSRKVFVKDYPKELVGRVEMRPRANEITEVNNQSFYYDILDHLLRVPVKVLLLDLIRMDQRTRNILLQALSMQGEPLPNQGSPECLLDISITFGHDDLLLGESKQSRPVYYIGYIQEVKVSQIQVGFGSGVNILLTQTMTHVGLAPKLLKDTSVSIHGYDGHGSKPFGKIRIKCQIGDMLVYPNCYVVEA